MIAKKNPKVDMERKRAAIFNVGLLVAGSFTLAAFTYTEATITEAEKLAVAVEENITFEVQPKEPEPDPVKTDQPQTQSDQQQNDQQNLGSQTGLAENINATDSKKEGPKKPDGPEVYGFSIPFEKPTFKDMDAIVIPDIDAAYVGGTGEMTRKIQTEIKYPEIDRVLGNQGKVYVSFVVEKDGSVTNVEVMEGRKNISETLDREAVRIVKTFPKWIPGKDKWGPVRTRVRLPITFILN
ncbi:MAG: energy transducer TonB [Crocinitomicaceae bacterium]